MVEPTETSTGIKIGTEVLISIGLIVTAIVIWKVITSSVFLQKYNKLKGTRVDSSTTIPTPVRKTNIGDLPPTPPLVSDQTPANSTPVPVKTITPTGNRPESAYKIVGEFTGDSALRGDFVDILGAMGKKLDQIAKDSEESRAVIQDLKKENLRLHNENAQLIDLLHNEKHRVLLRNLVKAANFCDQNIRVLQDNPKAIAALEFVRDECRDRLIDAGLTAYEPPLGSALSKIEGLLADVMPRTVPTDKLEHDNTLAEIQSVGYYYERDGKKLPVAKAELVFYKNSAISKSNTPETPQAQ
jgi:hypothetical protein